MFPHSRYSNLQNDWALLKTSWGVNSFDEVKASRLNEVQNSQAIELLLNNRATAYAVVYDSSLFDEENITQHKLSQARKISQRLDPRCTPEMRKHLIDRRRQCRSLPNQLYIQQKALVLLCHESLKVMLCEYPTTHPRELGKIETFIDAKNSSITSFEEYYQFIILPELQNKASRDPIGMIQGMDYSSFINSYCDTSKSVPKHLSNLYPNRQGSFDYIDIGKIFRGINIEQSHQHVGLQLADVVANTLTRLLKGNLQISGWQRYPQLFVHQKHGTIKMISFSDVPNSQPSYQKQIVYIHQKARKFTVKSDTR